MYCKYKRKLKKKKRKVTFYIACVGIGLAIVDNKRV